MGIIRQAHLFIAGSLLWGLPAVALCQDDATRALLGSLGSEDFKERTKAQQELSRWALEQPAGGQQWLFREFEAAGDPEVRLRLREVLKEVVVAEYQKNGPGYVGISMVDALVAVPGEERQRVGVSVTGVQPDTPASRAGLAVGDVVVSVDALQWSNEEATKGFQKAIMGRKPGETVELGVLRGGELKKIPVTLAARPMGLQDFSSGPEFGNLQGFQGLQAIPGFRINPLQLEPELLKAVEEQRKADEMKAKEECFESWLKDQRARAGKP